MTSMRMRLLFSLSCVHVLVRYIGGEGGVGGWGGGDDVHALLVRYICQSRFCVLFLCLILSAVLLLLGHQPRRHA